MFKIENDLLWVGTMIGILFLIWLFTGGPSRIQNGIFVKPLAPVGTGETYGSLASITPSSIGESVNNFSSSNSSNNGTFISASTKDVRTSRYKGLITIYSGNAFSEQSSNREYITIQGSANIKESINISGWTLKNGGADRYYNSYGQTIKGQSSSIKIPKAVLIWQKDKAMTVVPIKVEANQTVQIVSGYFPPIGEYNIRDSFRVNKCTGYFANQNDYYGLFYPSINALCPRIENEPGASTLYEQCYNFVRSLGTCQKPDFKEDWCYANIGGVASGNMICNLPSTCKDFVKKFASYEKCVENHRTDKDFYQPEWRVFLGSTWEIWAQRQETITLYDNEGKIVDQIKYNNY